jgi:BirA family biotin operon repressor/biotin-[acetyl-CoA-carboxylase] ligase
MLHTIEQVGSDPEGVLSAWRALDGTLGHAVRVGEVQGTAVDIEVSGALVVRTPSGELNKVLAGDVEMVAEA